MSKSQTTDSDSANAQKAKSPAAPAAAQLSAVGTPEAIAAPVKRSAAKRFPVVALGASAGGLEALTAFISHVPAHSGMAYVVLQHLDPEREDITPELLQRQTAMPVVHAQSRARLRRDHVYVLPPNKDLSILHDRLFLLDRELKHSIRMPIDFFLRSLAADQRNLAVAVILSGMGSDGTLGLRAIRENAGLTVVQEPATAAFSGMPQSAIQAELADIVARPEEMPGCILGYFKCAPHEMPPVPGALLEARNDTSLEQIVILLRERTGNDFSLYKKTTLSRRIERRMALHQIGSMGAYVQYLRESPDEQDLLFNELLIGVTSFFRDPPAWDALEATMFPALFAAYPGGKALRAWDAGCATGEEAYSLAISFNEALAHSKPAAAFSLQIFATDLDQSAIERARYGLYTANIADDIPSERLSRYFTQEDKGYRIRPEIREKVIFARQNIITDPPFQHVDIIICRNLLIYVSAELQRTLLRLFHHALSYRGFLMLGSAEGIGNFSSLFSCTDNQARIYRRIETSTQTIDLAYPASQGAALTRPAVESAPRESARNAAARKTGSESSGTAQDMAEQLRQALDELDTLRAEANVSRQELTATNEELQSANEELLTMNEELTTSREEMQSLNEELQAVNAELRSKLTQMASVTSDLANLLDSTEIATIFLDAEMKIRRFTPYATRLFKLLPVDLGRPLSHIACELDYPQLMSDAKEVLRTLVSSEMPAFTQDGRCFNVRIVPYRSIANFIDGVVITFTDLTEAHANSVALRQIMSLLAQPPMLATTDTEQPARLEALLQQIRQTLQMAALPPARLAALGSKRVPARPRAGQPAQSGKSTP